jgi:hypothetical protein
MFYIPYIAGRKQRNMADASGRHAVDNRMIA